MGIDDPGSTLVFAVIGDHGGIKGSAGNAVSDGLQKVGIEWSFIGRLAGLESELTATAARKPLVVSLHHPPSRSMSTTAAR